MTTATARPPPPPPPADEPRWTAEEVAAYLKLSLSKVYELARKKEIPSVRIGAQWRFDPDAVRAFARGEPPPPGAPVVPLSPGRRRRV